MRSWMSAASATLALLCLLADSQLALAQGFVLSGVGAVNRSMGGAGTAAPLDAIGALHWNPGSITALPGSRVDFNVESIYDRHSLDSSLFGGAVSGSSESDTGVMALPAFGLVYQPNDSSLTYGLEVAAIGGFSVNHGPSLTNPILTPAALGKSYSKLAIMQVAPTMAVKLTDTISFGVAPTFNMAEAQLDPFGLAAPDDANGDTIFTYQSAIQSRMRPGIGVQAGLFMDTELFNLGLSLKSPQWFQKFEYETTDEIGMPRQVEADITYPMILSLGYAYKGWDRWLIAVDARYVDFSSTETFGDSAGFDGTGAVTGLGWKSVFLTGVGAQYQVTDRWTLRGGYSYNTNPIPDQAAFYNTQAAAVYQHVLSVGSSYQLTRNIVSSITWVHGFHNAIDGPWQSPLGPVPGSVVRVDQEVDSLVMGLGVVF